MQKEVDDMLKVMMGDVPPPIDVGVMTLMEVAEAYHARVCEMTLWIQRREAKGIIEKGSEAYQFRTGELRTMTELLKRAVDLGSRRVTGVQQDMEMRGGGGTPGFGYYRDEADA